MIRRLRPILTTPERGIACLIVAGVAWLLSLGLLGLGIYCFALPWIYDDSQLAPPEALAAGLTFLVLAVGVFFLWRRILRPALFE